MNVQSDPVRLGRYWLFPDGTLLPAVAGGATDGGEADGEGDPPPDDGEGDPPPEDAPDPAKEAAKWKALARKHEERAKANADAAARLKELEHAGKSETEKLQALLDEERVKARESRVRALKLSVAAEKGLPQGLARFLPDLDDEVDMMQAADELLEAAGSAGTADQPTRQPKSTLTNPLKDDDAPDQHERLVNAMLGQSSL